MATFDIVTAGDLYPRSTTAEMIRECHARFGEVEHPPQLISERRAAHRLRMLREEVDELADWIDAGDLVKIADALGDIEYVLHGTAFAYGVPLDEVTAEIHRSNMTKSFEGAEGEDVKLIKGAHYEPPNLDPILKATTRRFRNDGAPTSAALLDTPMGSNGADAATIRDYLIKLLADVWEYGESFDGRRPFGNSGWEWELYGALIKAGHLTGRFDRDGDLEDVDVEAGDELIAAAIRALA